MSVDRARLRFVEVVREQFLGLAAIGYEEAEASELEVRFRNEEFGVDVKLCHETLSYEVYCTVEWEQYACTPADLLRVSDPEAAKRYRDPSGHTPESVQLAVAEVARIVVAHGTRALRGDPGFFARAAVLRAEAADVWYRQQRAVEIRRMAFAAFRERRYCECIDLYEQIVDMLSPAEMAKLHYARRRV
ncbi:MAG: hypothetical protein KDC95_00825 [Planctomycetes bacterium]|nr:hypothetical protein [Planctomycetota bacterium]